MKNLTTWLKSFDFQEWVFFLTSLATITIGLLDFTGLLPQGTPLLSRITMIAIGIFMTSFLVQIKRQEVSSAQLIDSLKQSLEAQIAVEEFNKPELGVEYLASRVLLANESIYQASLSAPLERWHQANFRYESAVRDVASQNRVTIHYIANFSDEARLQRVRNILDNSAAKRFHVRSFNRRSVVHPLNFSIIDEKEIVLSVPAGAEKEDKFLSIRNQRIVAAFVQYFNLLWEQAVPFDNRKVKRGSEKRQSKRQPPSKS